MVPEQAHEEQEKLPAASGAAAEQQQREHQQPEPPWRPSPSRAPRPLAAPRGQPPRFRKRGAETPPVTNGVFRGCYGPLSPRSGHLSTLFGFANSQKF